MKTLAMMLHGALLKHCVRTSTENCKEFLDLTVRVCEEKMQERGAKEASWQCAFEGLTDICIKVQKSDDLNVTTITLTVFGEQKNIQLRLIDSNNPSSKIYSYSFKGNLSI